MYVLERYPHLINHQFCFLRPVSFDEVWPVSVSMLTNETCQFILEEMEEVCEERSLLELWLDMYWYIFSFWTP